MCGILGIVLPKEFSNDNFAATYVIESLVYVQHRGESSCGCCSSDGLAIKKWTGAGKVEDIFFKDPARSSKLSNLKGHVAVGHTRYPTAGCDTEGDAQPLRRKLPTMMMAHNGNVVNRKQLEEILQGMDVDLSTGCDVEIIMDLLGETVKRIEGGGRTDESICGALKKVYSIIDGAYSVIGTIRDKFIAFRDPCGIKPLVFGQKEIGDYKIYGFASESTPLTQMEFELGSIVDIKPGHVMIIGPDHQPREYLIKQADKTGFCSFEFAYFAIHSSKIEKRSVSLVRKNLGKELADLAVEKGLEIDAACAIPDTSRLAAYGFVDEIRSRGHNVALVEPIIKERYIGIGRSFIHPTIEETEAILDRKYIFDPWIPTDNIAIIEDSIIKGSTLKRVITAYKESTGRQPNIHLFITYPPVRHPCPYGIDMQSRDRFIAVNKTEEVLAKEFGVASVTYLTLDRFIRATKLPDGSTLDMCFGCSNNDYVSGLTEEQIADMGLNRKSELSVYKKNGA